MNGCGVLALEDVDGIIRKGVTVFTKVAEKFAALFATFGGHLRSTSSVRQVVPPDAHSISWLRRPGA